MAVFVPGFGVVGGQRQNSANPATAQGELYPVGNRSDGVLFQYNPERISRRRQPIYAEVGAAAADYWETYNGPSPLQWVRNPPEVINFELLLTATGNDNIEPQLAKLRKMMSRASRSPRGTVPGPPDLIFSYGKRADTVRIMSAEFDEERHTSELDVQQARVKLDLKTVSIGSK